jgi:hypothetical protein
MFGFPYDLEGSVGQKDDKTPIKSGVSTIFAD